MSQQGRRVRVITDKAKYRRHQRKKLLRKMLKVAAWACILIVGIVIVWLVLDILFRSRPLSAEFRQIGQQSFITFLLRRCAARSVLATAPIEAPQNPCWP